MSREKAREKAYQAFLDTFNDLNMREAIYAALDSYESARKTEWKEEHLRELIERAEADHETSVDEYREVTFYALEYLRSLQEQKP